MISSPTLFFNPPATQSGLTKLIFRSPDENEQKITINEGTTSEQGNRDIERKLVSDRVLLVFNSIVADLERYENQFEMDSETFYQAFQSSEIEEEREDYYDWRAKISAYRRMNRRFGLTR